jgi:Ca-activated chloride channel family protein
MKRLALGLVPAFLAACAASPSPQSTLQIATVATHRTTVATAVTDAGAWLRAAPVQTRVMQNSDGTTWVGFWIDTPAAAASAQRPPLDVALVVDTSGSMSGSKIDNARLAAASFLDGLADGDVVSLYSFSDQVTELAPPTTVSAPARAVLMQRVQGLFAAGGTNLHDGLLAGRLATDAAPASHPVRRIVMISDGRATVGDTDPGSIANVAAQATEHGTQVTAIGVGLDYDEGMLNAMAVRSAGRLYHLEEPQQMATILHNELELLGDTVAANVYIELTPAEGVTVEGTDAVRIDRRGPVVRVPLGSLYGAQHREVLLRARIPTTGAGARTLGEARLVWQEPGATSPREGAPVAMRYELTSDPAAPAQSVQERVQAMVVSYEAAQSQVRATRMLNEGHAERAEQELRQAEVRIQEAQRTYHFSDDVVQGSLARQSAGLSSGRAAASAAAQAPAAARPARARAAALQNNSSAMDALGF